MDIPNSVVETSDDGKGLCKWEISYMLYMILTNLYCSNMQFFYRPKLSSLYLYPNILMHFILSALKANSVKMIILFILV